jgi:hypothetical protein
MTEIGETARGTVASLRGFLLAVLLLGVVGTLSELYLLEHFEEWWQRAPMAVLGLSIPLILLCAASPSPGALRALRFLMLAFVVVGFLGVWRHYAGNAEFELEMYPSRAGLELIWESLKGATPALAPASLSWLGLIGLVYAFQHPAGRRMDP